MLRGRVEEMWNPAALPKGDTSVEVRDLIPEPRPGADAMTEGIVAVAGLPVMFDGDGTQFAQEILRRRQSLRSAGRARSRSRAGSSAMGGDHIRCEPASTMRPAPRLVRFSMFGRLPYRCVAGWMVKQSRGRSITKAGRACR
jgi:hypothetical protein